MDSRRLVHARQLPISVVVPAYNRAELLEAALASVEAQTFAPTEVIVVDDGSMEEDLKPVADRHNAAYIRQENRGASAARNAGMHAARCPWVAFLDADDLWLPQKLELQWNALSRTRGYSAVISNFRIVTPLGTFDETAFELNEAYQRIDKREVFPDVYELSMTSAGRALARSMFVQPSGLLVMRAVALGIGGFDTGMRRCEDHEFALRLFGVARVLSIDNAVVRYRVHSVSLSKNEVEMRLGELDLVTRVLAAPERYPAGAAEVIKEMRPILVRKAAASFAKQGDVASARRLLRSVLRYDRTPKTLGVYAATLLAPSQIPKRHTQRLLQLWRRRPWHRAEGWDRAPVWSTGLHGAETGE